MAWTSAIPIIGNVIDGVSAWAERRQRIKQAETEGQIALTKAKFEAQAARVLDAQNHAQSWEISALERAGWRDDGITVLVIVLVLSCFCPWTQPHVDAGFSALATTPYWFQVIVVIVLTQPFGVRVFDAYKRVLEWRKGDKK